MKRRSPKRLKPEKISDELNPLALSTFKNDTLLLPEGSAPNWAHIPSTFQVEPFSTLKVFSPVLTPRKKRTKEIGESVWRTPEPKHFELEDRQFMDLRSPVPQLVYQYKSRRAAKSRTVRFGYQSNIRQIEFY